jgi:putative methyltransferase (TIGR04325 family)
VKTLTRKLLKPFRRRDNDAITFTGDYASWAEALKNSTGYNTEVILQRTRAAQLKVKRGEAVYARDSVLFDKPELPWPVMACLLKVAAENRGTLSVLDFGGALGSTYFGCRAFFTCLQELHWSVVEQPAYVACGREEFQDDQLRFYSTIDECLGYETPKVLLLSSVLQYLENPWEFLAALPHAQLLYVLLDQTTFFMDDTADRLTVQTVPESIYPASYPCWMLNYTHLLNVLTGTYDIVVEFPAHIGVTIPLENKTCAVYAGLLLKRKYGRRNHDLP